MTHINAFYADVEAAKAKVAVAQSELETAETALRTHPDFTEPEAAEVVEAEPAKKQNQLRRLRNSFLRM